MGSVTFATSGERRLAERLVDKLEDDVLCWYDVPVGPHRRRPDFIIFHPQHGLLVLEVKDWTCDTIRGIDRIRAEIVDGDGRLKKVSNPIEQARECLLEAVTLLSKDPQLVFSAGEHKGKIIFPYGHGVVLANITRKQFDSTDLGEAIPPGLVVCKDEMTDSAAPLEFQERLWRMFPYRFPHAVSLPQIDRVRWHLFPEVRIGHQGDLFEQDNKLEVPDLLRVMDLQQEQLARSLGEGHRVIHGVAGSGKTLILGYRAEHLAQVCTRPILTLCYNKTLAARLGDVMSQKRLSGKVHVHNFHQWVRRQLVAYNIPLPKNPDFDASCQESVDLLIRSVAAGHIPSGQYDAVLIDEGHDFRPEWLKLVVQMIHPNSRSLLVLYDDAQSIYEGPKKRRFTFSSVGVEARGRTTILRLNYRNTTEILAVARAFAEDLLTAREGAEDEAPVISPMSAGRHGPVPLLVPLPSLLDEAAYIANELQSAREAGRSWKEMAVIYRTWTIGKAVAEALKRKGIPNEAPQFDKASFHPGQDSVKLITMHSSKGLEFPVVCIPGLNGMPANNLDPIEEARLLYVAMTRATESLVLTRSGESVFTERIRRAVESGAAVHG